MASPESLSPKFMVSPSVVPKLTSSKSVNNLGTMSSPLRKEIAEVKRRLEDEGPPCPNTTFDTVSEESSAGTIDRLAELIRWVPGSNQQLFDAEDNLLAFVKAPHELVHVSIGLAPDLQGRCVSAAADGDGHSNSEKHGGMLSLVPSVPNVLPRFTVVGANQMLETLSHGVGFSRPGSVDPDGNCYINTLLIGDVAEVFREIHPEFKASAEKGGDATAEESKEEAATAMEAAKVSSSTPAKPSMAQKFWAAMTPFSKSMPKVHSIPSSVEDPSSPRSVGSEAGNLDEKHQGDLGQDVPGEHEGNADTGLRSDSSEVQEGGATQNAVTTLDGNGESGNKPRNGERRDSENERAQSSESGTGQSNREMQDGEAGGLTGASQKGDSVEGTSEDIASRSEHTERDAYLPRGTPDKPENSYGEQEVGDSGSISPTVQAKRAESERKLFAKKNLVMVHGFAACIGFFFRNFDTLSDYFNIYAIDQLGWGASSRPSFTPRTAEEAEAWFVEALELWRQELGLQKFVLLGHSFGGYISSRYTLKYPQHVEHLVLVGPAGFNHVSPKMQKFKQTWKGYLLGMLWETNLTPQLMIRFLGPFSEDLVKRSVVQRWTNLPEGQEDMTSDQVAAFSEYTFQSLLAPMSGELCMKHVFSLGAFARRPLIDSAPTWKVPTTFIYGQDDIMDYRAGLGASKAMPVPSEVLLVQEAGHMLFLEKPTLFNYAVLYGCRDLLPADLPIIAEAAAAVHPYIVPHSQCHGIPTDGDTALFVSQGPGRGAFRLASGWGIG